MQTNLKINSNFFEKISRIIDYYGLKNVSELSEKLGYSSPEKLNRLKKEGTKPSLDILNDISNLFEDLSGDWLISGKEPMIRSVENNSMVAEADAPYNRAPQIITVDSHNHDNIVLVPMKAQAGYLKGLSKPDFIKKLPTFRMPGLNNGTFRMFEVFGNSMFPTLPDRSYVVGEFVENWATGIKDNRLYVIVSNKIEDGLVKRCINKIEKYNNLICKSDNRREYPTQSLDPSDIMEVWEVKLHLNFSIPDPADIYDRVNDLEGEVISLKEIVKKAKLLP